MTKGQIKKLEAGNYEAKITKVKVTKKHNVLITMQLSVPDASLTKTLAIPRAIKMYKLRGSGK